MTARVLALAITISMLAWPRAARAWIFPEHVDIADAAIHRLSPEAQAFYREVWEAARASRACTELVAAGQGESPACIDFAAWSAIAGDHSCSPRDLLDGVLPGTWIMDAARVGAEAKRNLAGAKNEREILTYWARSDLGLERVDPDYSARAVTNNAHFLLARWTNDAAEYGAGAIATNAEVNALGLVVTYHLAALRLARAWRASTGAERSVLARWILATEVFALHFLEDSFAAGHAAGTWGDASSRKGTHDYYCTHGLDTHTWRGSPATLFGDAHIKAADLERTSRAVAASLTQIYEATRDDYALAAAVDRLSWAGATRITGFDSCKEKTMASAGLGPEHLHAMGDLLLDTPYPAQVESGAPLPRFRAEIGPYVGVYSSARAADVVRGYSSAGLRPRPVGSLDVGVRVGVGLERLVGASGLTFVQGGFVSESAQVNRCSSDECSGDYRLDTLLPQVPARTGLAFRLHAPFWLIPGDLLLAGPFVALASWESFKQMAILAGAGGLIPWQRDIYTPIGTVQFIAGRDAGITFYGLLKGPSVAAAPTEKDATGRQQYAVVELQTLELEFPIVEYRPFHEFAMREAFTMAVQLGYAADIPTSLKILNMPDIPKPDLSPAHLVTLRIVFDVRHYL